MSQPIRIDSVTDSESREEIGIAPVPPNKRDPFIDDAKQQSTFETVTALILAVILITIAIGISRIM